jgi:hypothetical protein
VESLCRELDPKQLATNAAGLNSCCVAWSFHFQQLRKYWESTVSSVSIVRFQVATSKKLCLRGGVCTIRSLEAIDYRIL